MCWIYITCELHINNRYNNQYNNKKNKNIWGPKFVFPAFQVQIPRSHVHNPNLKRNGCLVSQNGSLPQKGPNWLQMELQMEHLPSGDTLKSGVQTKFKAKPVEISPFRTERTIGPKNVPCPKPLFSDRKWNFGRCQSGDIIQAAEIALSQSYGLGYFWSQKRTIAQNPLCHAHISNFILGFCSCGGSNRILKIRAKFTMPISCESATKFGAQKRELGPKKKI